MKAGVQSAFGRSAGRFLLSAACFGGAFGAHGYGQIVPTLSPPVFSIPLYVNPFDFPGSAPLVPPVGTPIPQPMDTPSASRVVGASGPVDPIAPALTGAASIESSGAAMGQPVVFGEQRTAPRLEQLTAPEMRPRTLEDQQQANPKIEQLTLPLESSPGVGAQPLAGIRMAPQSPASKRLNTLLPNAEERTRSQLTTQGAWFMAGSRRTTVLAAKPDDPPISRATTWESYTYTKLGPLSPEVLATGSAFHSPAMGTSTPTGIALHSTTGTPLAFRSNIATDLHAQRSKRSQSKPGETQTGQHSRTPFSPFNSTTLSSPRSGIPQVPHLGQGSHPEADRQPSRAN